MSIYGFCNNKCKHEVYTKNEADDKSVVVSSTEPTTNEKVWLKKGKNLFNPSSMPVSTGLWVNTDTNKIFSAASGKYVIVPIQGGNTITISKEGNGLYYTTTSAYPAEGVGLLDNWTGSETIKKVTITTNQNAKYLFLGLYSTTNLMVEYNSTATEYEPYIEKATYTKNDNGVYEEFYNESEVDTKLANYKLKGDFAVISQSIVVGSSTAGTATLDYPAGFSYDNCIPVACGLKIIDNKGYNYDGTYGESSDALNNSYKRRFNLNSSNIVLTVFNPNDGAMTANYKIVLMKI